MQTLPKTSLYDDLLALPKSLTGEILQGQLHAHPRPSGRHILAASNINAEIHGPYQRGRGGPGGWWILLEPEVHFVLDKEVAVPDVAGWRKERLSAIADSHKFEVTPDWICEILSPSTASIDREVKMPLYAEYGVGYLWLVDPKKKSLEAYKLAGNAWHSLGVFSDADRITVEPFEAIEVTLDELLG